MIAFARIKSWFSWYCYMDPDLIWLYWIVVGYCFVEKRPQGVRSLLHLILAKGWEAMSGHFLATKVFCLTDLTCSLGHKKSLKMQKHMEIYQIRSHLVLYNNITFDYLSFILALCSAIHWTYYCNKTIHWVSPIISFTQIKTYTY